MNNISKTKQKISYILKTIVILSSIIGTIASYLAGRTSFMGGNHVFMYFTIQSNIAIAIISAIGLYFMATNKPVNKIWYVIKFVGTVSITLTGVVFCFVLAPTLGIYAWNMQNVLTHVIVPIGAIIDFFVISGVTKVSKLNTLYVIIPPIIYAIYAGIGYVKGWEFAEGINYPYFFLNWGSKAGAFGFTNELPFMGSAWWILVLLIFLIVVGYIYLIIADFFRKK
ncbi:MAG: Pr6Pr family membrane protein [Butyrivibrio sp.]|nr:Pr6Pr family membrane protein [Butyrivibrio sp.]